MVKKPFEQFAIGQADGAARGEQDLDLISQRSRRRAFGHGSGASIADPTVVT